MCSVNEFIQYIRIEYGKLRTLCWETAIYGSENGSELTEWEIPRKFLFTGESLCDEDESDKKLKCFSNFPIT